jgi:hypothetical protein
MNLYHHNAYVADLLVLVFLSEFRVVNFPWNFAELCTRKSAEENPILKKFRLTTVDTICKYRVYDKNASEVVTKNRLPVSTKDENAIFSETGAGAGGTALPLQVGHHFHTWLQFLRYFI